MAGPAAQIAAPRNASVSRTWRLFKLVARPEWRLRRPLRCHSGAGLFLRRPKRCGGPEHSAGIQCQWNSIQNWSL